MKKSHLVALIALFTACNTPAADPVPSSRSAKSAQPAPKKVHLDERQQKYLNTYCSKRWWSICFLRIAGHDLRFDSSLEQLKPIVIDKLKLKSTATWDDVVAHEKIAKYFAEWDRATVGESLCGDKNASWDRIINAVESLRLRKKSGEIGYKRPGRSLFYGRT